MTGQTQGSSSTGTGTSAATTTTDDDEGDDPSSDPTVPVDNSVVTAPPAYPVEDNRRSGLQDSDTATTSRIDNSPATTLGASSTTQSSGDVTGLSTTNTTVSVDNTETATLTDTNTATLVLDLPQGPDPQESDDPVAVLTAIELDSELLAGGGLSTDGPVAPPLPGVILGSLDLVRRDLEQMSAPLNDDTTQGTTDPLIIDPQNNDSGAVQLTAATTPQRGSWSVSDPLTMDPTIAERNSLFQTDQAKRITAFAEQQAERTKAFNEQQAQYANSPLGAILNSAAFVVSELANTAAFVVTEFVNYISTAITNFVQGISDWFTAPAVFTGTYGNPAASAQYWQKQNAENCVLMASAMLVGELKGLSAMPNEVQIADQAVAEGMYQGLNTNDRVAIEDAVKLLDKYYGITAEVTSYSKTQGNIALRAVAYALQDKKAVSVGLNAGAIWNEVDGVDPPDDVSAADHQVVVTGIDFDARVVHLNDSGPDNGANMKVSLDTFMRAWQTDNYETMIATVKVPNTPASAVTSTDVSGSTVLVSV